ncbi:hypothetical protein [Comamonas sp. B21-038]|uniref:hypothetical protein n=1 Tax=Comamonas sp. B21-038 TaxID=2918299 RepID=UPI001EFA4BFB|nr:hypothetical protein [Comamonas sp. B21-038]ULR87371.1 hypothetical protein MJ205_12940 [Comamonas sp. B21-038]
MGFLKISRLGRFIFSSSGGPNPLEPINGSGPIRGTIEMAHRPFLLKGPVYITITASVRSPDIRALAISAGWVGYEPLYCTINAGVDVAALSIANIPSGLLTIINRGRIGAMVGGAFGLYTRTLINIDNAGGTIFGAGGTGGAGGSLRIQNPNSPSFYAAGDGGAGGAGAGFSTISTLTLQPASNGDPGRSETLGGSSVGGIGVSTGGRGGNGGPIGQSGASGESGTASGNYNLIQVFSPGAGQPAGNYVDGNAYINWLATGTRLGNAI